MPRCRTFRIQCNRFQPSEALFNPLPLDLAYGIAGVPRGPAVDGASAAAVLILRHVRRDIDVPTFRHKLRCIVRLVGSHRDSLRAGNLFQHHQRRVRGCGRYEEEQNDDGQQCDPIERFHTKQQSPEKSSHARRPGTTSDDTGRDQPHALADYEVSYLRSGRAKSHTDF